MDQQTDNMTTVKELHDSQGIPDKLHIHYGRRPKPNIFKRVIVGMAQIVIGLSTISLWLGGIAIYLWTVIIAFMYGGFISALLTFILPVIGQIFWAWKSYVYTGYFWNTFIVALVSYIAVWVIVLVSALILSIFGED